VGENTLTFALHGEVTLKTFADEISRWRALVEKLTEQVGTGQPVRWVIEELAAGSATATVRAFGDEPTAAAVVDAYVDVGTALAQGRPEMLAPQIRSEALALTVAINGEVDYIRFETARDDLIVTLNYDQLLERARGELEPPVPMNPALGGVQGRIQTLTSRGALRFTLYDTLFDRAVNCYLREGQEEIMRDLWGQSAIVEGVVTRAPDTGRPLNVREVWNVTPVRQIKPGAYQDARGAIKVPPADPRTPEALVAAARDD
jgi:hypothetical protein